MELEETAARENGLRHINIPVLFPDSKDKQVAELLKITADPNIIAREQFGAAYSG